MTPEDMARVRDAEPLDGRAWGIADKRNRTVTVRLFDGRGAPLAEAEATTGAQAFDLAYGRVTA